jgi:hypothetical protein
MECKVLLIYIFTFNRALWSSCSYGRAYIPRHTGCKQRLKINTVPSMSSPVPFTPRTILVATVFSMSETYNVPRFMSFTPYLAGIDRLAHLLGAVRAASARSLTTTCDLCLHAGRVRVGRAEVVFATAACRDTWYACQEDARAPDLAARMSSSPALVRDPHLEMHIDGRCLLRCYVGGAAMQIQSRHVFSRSSIVPALAVAQVA